MQSNARFFCSRAAEQHGRLWNVSTIHRALEEIDSTLSADGGGALDVDLFGRVRYGCWIGILGFYHRV